MSKTLLVIFLVLAVFAGIYLTAPNILQGLGGGTQLSGLPREGNGLIGRFIDFMAESTWHPVQFLLGLSLFLAVSSGLVLYWRRFCD